MSENTTATRALHADASPEPLSGLTGAPAAIYTELSASTGATVAELALAARIGRSTAGKALATLEEHGLAVREEGERTGARRTPDQWRCAQPAADATPDTDKPEEAADDAPDTSEHVLTESAAEAETETPAHEPEPARSSDDEPVTTAEDAETPSAGSDSTSAAPDGTDAEDEQPKPPTIAASPAPASGGKARPAPGALRQLVIDHLTAHPQEAFTATAISRKIEKSSGAIANSLVTLAKQNIAEQVNDRPRTYRLAARTEAD
ncbi:helix-turn-helix domain-containing protein [Streptomyces sp. ISL-100]|uniref:MarR family transcriptional regulator n=1 Tax=Streptomyces sp. ISL-100 TaxID=2819173 RepID=UPI001BE67E32|nr:helix-turn-helix domain-containing protein [Streptomyces sp. ISL-100]MBT2396673.1 hypothetical protein [Streptomyces sp. ISL-100]